MNDKNLIPFTKRTPREHSKLSKMGAKKSNEVQKKKKEEAKQNEKLVDILKKVIFSEVKSEVVKKKSKNSALKEAIISLLFVQFQQQKLCKKEILM